MPRGLRRWGLAAACLVDPATALTGAAQEVCVACSEPSAWYRCSVEGTSAASPVAGLQLYCMKELAHRGNHQLCRIERARAGEPCSAPLVVLAAPSGGFIPTPAPTPLGARPPSPPSTGAPAEAVAANSPVPADASDKPVGTMAPPPPAPATVEELAKQGAADTQRNWDAAQEAVKATGTATGQTIENAGNAVGDVVAKSWTCVTSLLKACK